MTPIIYHEVIPSRDLGGGNLVALNLSADLQQRGEKTVVWVPGEGGSLERARSLQLATRPYNGEAFFQGGRLRHLLHSWRLSRSLRNLPGLVHVHSPLCYGSLSWGLARSGLPRVVHVQLEEEEKGLRWALKRPPELIVTCARFLKDSVQQCLPESVAAQQWIEAVPNSVDLEQFQPGDRDATKARLGLPLDKPLVLMLANLSQHKGQETTIRAVAALKQRGIDVLCWLAGNERGGTTTYQEYLRKFIVDRGVEDRVRLLGFHNNPVELLHAADYFLLPSTNEGLPLTILEAQATKVPVLASSTAGIPETIRDGETGFMIEPHDIEGYAACLERMIHAPELRRQITEKAYQFVVSEHSWKTFCNRLWELYQELLARREVSGKVARSLNAESIGVSSN